MGLPPTGKKFTMPMVFLFTIRDGRIQHERRVYDFTGLMIQLGVLKAKPA
jgi:predicted ester cyclase